MNERRNSGVLLDEREALTLYLDSLLQEISEAPAPIEVPAASAALPASSPIEPVPDAAAKAPIPGPEARPSAPPAGGETGRPDWADGPFQCLTFSVAGLTLAVPLVKLNGIIEISGEITPMPGHQPWFLGLACHLDRKVKVVDIGRIVLPQGRQYVPVVPDHVILIDESRWGIACEGTTQMISLPPEGVRWRTSRGRRAWLAGTAIEHMCAILDVDALAGELATGQWA